MHGLRGAPGLAGGRVRRYKAAMGEHELLRVVSFESRRADDMASLLRRHGMDPTMAPSMQEVPLGDQADALAFGKTLLARELDILVLLTGVGFRMLVEAIATEHPLDDVLAALRDIKLVCRGPKPVAVLKGWGLTPAVVAPAPNTWRELLVALDAELPVTRQRVVVQEYGIRNDELLDALDDRGAELASVPVYAWKMPDDTSALRAAVADCCEERVDGLVFTSQQQVHNLMETAVSMDCRDALVEAMRRRLVVGSIGPITSEALAACGIVADLEPELGRMGHLVKLMAADGRGRLAVKRGA